MAPQITDKTALTISSAMCGGYGAFSLGAPKKFNETFFVADQPTHKDMGRWFGFALLTSSAAGLVGAMSKDPETRRNMLKLHAGSNLACAGLNVYSAHKGKQEKKPAYANAALGVVAAGLLAAKAATSKE